MHLEEEYVSAEKKTTKKRFKRGRVEREMRQWQREENKKKTQKSFRGGEVVKGKEKK